MRRELRHNGHTIEITAVRASESLEIHETRTDARPATMNGIWKSAKRFWQSRKSIVRRIKRKSEKDDESETLNVSTASRTTNRLKEL